jgi:general secretion pathway protein I
MSRSASIGILDVAARHDGQRGFALLEILVAFVILALGLGAISTGIAVAMRSDGHAQMSRVAYHLAQSRLEAAGINGALVPGRREGRTASQYKWQETVTAVGLDSAPEQPRNGKNNPAPAGAGIASFWVEITVQAADGTVAGLAALKLSPETKP